MTLCKKNAAIYSFLIDAKTGEESIELEMGWNQYIENKLSIHGETYLVAVKGELSSDVDDNPVLKVEIVYLEEAMRRKLYVTFVKDRSAHSAQAFHYIQNFPDVLPSRADIRIRKYLLYYLLFS